MKNILITGGAGFIGSHLIKIFIKKYSHYNIINLDNLTYAGNLDNLKEVSNFSNYNFEKIDICDFKNIESVLKKYDIFSDVSRHGDSSLITILFMRFRSWSFS